MVLTHIAWAAITTFVRTGFPRTSNSERGIAVPRFNVLNKISKELGMYNTFMGIKKLYWVCAVLSGIILMLLGIIYFKTNLVQRVAQRMGLYESKPIDNPNYWCIQGWTNTLEKMDIDFDIVFFGNSITRGSSFHEYFTNTSICNLGFPGDNLDGMMLRVNQIKAVNPKKVFLMAGINGLNYQTLQVFKEKYGRLVKAIKESNPKSIIHLQSILPVNNSIAQNYVCSNEKIKDANIIIKGIATENECIYIDVHQLYVKDGEMDASLSRDGVHLLPESYDAWANLLKPYVEENQ